MKRQETTEKQHSVKQLRNFQANVTTKDGEAFVCVTKTKDEKVGLSWKGTKQDLLNLLFTACRNDKQMAALICRAAKDHIDYCKGTHQDWVNAWNQYGAASLSEVPGRK